MYTLVQTAKMNDLNPETYLRDTLAKIAEGHPINKLDELMPWQTLPADVADVTAYVVAPPGIESEFST
jgi:transposase